MDEPGDPRQAGRQAGRHKKAPRNADALALDLHKKRPGVQKLSMLLHLSEHMNYVLFVVFF
jgi:hypothetical protein